MKQQFKVDRFSSLTKDFRYSKSKHHDGFETRIAVRRFSEHVVMCGIILEPADENHICCDVSSAFSVLNQTTQQPVLVRAGSHTIGRCRQASCRMNKSDLMDNEICVDDAVVFEVECTLSVASASYGDPHSACTKMTPSIMTAEFFNNKSMSDVTFLVGPDEVAVPANKAVLALRSPVFKTMFYGSLPETTGSIKIPDVHVTAFASLLRYICCMEAVIDRSLIKETLYAADKYEVMDVKQAIGVLTDNETIYEIIDYSTSTQTKPNLLLKMEMSLPTKANFLSSPLFLSLLPSSIKWIISHQRLQVGEITLWNRCVEWAKVQCNRKHISDPTAADLRTEMEPFLHKFCFPAMSASDFVTGPADSNILNQEELQDIYKFRLCKIQPKLFPMKRSH